MIQENVNHQQMIMLKTKIPIQRTISELNQHDVNDETNDITKLNYD